jgi:hypothetical protein
MIKFLLTALLNLIGIGFLILVIVVPITPQFKNDSRVDNLLGLALCNPGEHLVREPVSGILSRLGIVITPYCVNGQARRDVTFRWITLGLSGFAFVFLFDIVLQIALILNAIRHAIFRSIRRRNSTPSQPVNIPVPPAPVSLKDQLQQLEDAQKAGLITYDEYDRLRQDILGKQSQKR